MPFFDSGYRKRFRKLIFAAANAQGDKMSNIPPFNSNESKQKLAATWCIIVPLNFLETAFVTETGCDVMGKCLREIDPSDVQLMFERTAIAHLGFLKFASETNPKLGKKAVSNFLNDARSLHSSEHSITPDLLVTFFQGDERPTNWIRTMLLNILPSHANQTFAKALRSDPISSFQLELVCSKLTECSYGGIALTVKEDSLDPYKH